MTKPIKCPDCGKKMVLRIASKGKFVGKPFTVVQIFQFVKKIVNFKEEAEKEKKRNQIQKRLIKLIIKP